MGNEMGNSNITGVQEQDRPGIDDANKPTEVSQLTTDRTVQEDKLLGLNLDQKAVKESNAAEERDNSVLQQTCQDREEENTTLMANARVHAMEPSPTQAEDLISTEQEEATLIADLVEQPIQQIRSEESHACSESSDTIDGEEESRNEEVKVTKGEGEESRDGAKMPNGDGTEQQDSLVAESFPDQKINSGDDMVQNLQMLNTVVENDLISAFDNNPVDEPKEESGKQEILAEIDGESLIQSNNEGEQDQTEKPIGFGAENELKELDSDDPMESFYLETIESEIRTVCFEANNKKTEIRPEAAPDRCYENELQVLEDDINRKGENGELRMEILPQNGEERQLEKNSLEFESPEISQITEDLEDEGDMIEISGSLTHFVNSSPPQEKETEHFSDGAGKTVKFPDTEKRSKGAQVQISSSSSSDSDAEVSEEMQHSDTAIEVADYIEGLASTCPKEAQQDNNSVTEEQERKPVECISACTELLMEEEVRANPPPPLELLQELEEQHLVIESRKRETERCLPGFLEEKQENAENFGLDEGSNPAENSEQAVNSEDESLKQEEKTHVIRCADESNSAVESEKSETEVMNSEPPQGNSETERISFDFQNPIPETRFSDVQSTKADIFRSQIFPQPLDVKTGTNGLKENHSEEDEPVTKVPIAETEVLIPGATKEEPREETVPNEKSSPNCNGSAIKRTDSVKSKPQPQKEDATAVDSLQMQETAASPDKKKIVATSPRMTRKQRSRSSLFSSCMCCTTVIQ